VFGERKKVLKIDAPCGMRAQKVQRVLKFDSGLWPLRVVDSPTGETTHWIFSRLTTPYKSSSLCTAFGGYEYKVDVTGLAFVSLLLPSHFEQW
jgi:hypothetical protein